MGSRERTIGLFYEAAINPSLWPLALDAFSAGTGSVGAHLIAFDRQTLLPRWGFLGGSVIAPDSMGLYIQHYKNVDPLIPTMVVAPVANSAMLCHEFIPQESVARSEYYQDFLIPSHGRYQAGWNLESNSDRVTALGLHKCKSRFERNELAAWEPVARHARHAAQLSVELGTRLAHGEMMRQAVDHHQMACFLVDANARVLDCSHAGQKLLDSGGIFKLLPNGHLATSSEPSTGRLLALIVQAANGRGGGICNLPGDIQAMPWTVRVVPCGVTSDNPFAPGHAGCALIFADPPRSSAQLNSHTLQTVLGCTPAEAEVAALLVSGHSPAEIADQRDVALSTVRTQIRVLLARTGLRRITDLVILLNGI